MSGGLKLYSDFLSQPCRSLYIILKQSGTSFDVVPISLVKGEQLTKEFKQLNRFQKVPSIVEGNFQLAESVAILRYLTSTNRVSESLYGGNEYNRARIDEFLQWHYSLRRETLNFFHLDFVAPIRTGQSTPKKQLDEAKRDMENVFSIVENIWLESSKFVAGSQMTVADLFGVSEVQQTKVSNYDVGKKFPKIAEWIENVRQKTNPHFDEAHKVIYKLAKKSVMER